jgi:hypothetical protein
LNLVTVARLAISVAKGNRDSSLEQVVLGRGKPVGTPLGAPLAHPITLGLNCPIESEFNYPIIRLWNLRDGPSTEGGKLFFAS